MTTFRSLFSFGLLTYGTVDPSASRGRSKSGGTPAAEDIPGFSIFRFLIAVCAVVVFSTPLQVEAGDRVPNAGRLPEFSWDRVPQYMHIRKWKNYTPEEIDYLATFPLVTLEKANGTRVFDTNEDGTLAAARAIKKVNPSTKILYYRNVIVHYPGYRDDEAINAIPGGFLVARDGKGMLIRGKFEAYDLTNPEVREWWVANPKSVCADPAIDGLFLDGIVKILRTGFLKRLVGEEKQAAMLAGYQSMVEETRKALGPDKIMLANVLRVGIPDSGLVEIQRFDGSYMENLEMGRNGKRKDLVAKGIEAFQQAAREGYLMAFTAGLSEQNAEEGELNPLQTDEIRKGLGKDHDSTERFNYLLAIFLICAEKHSYFLAHDGYLADKSKVWMKRPPELERPLGPPQGPAVRDGYIYTREFAHAKVRLDIENQTGEIEWIEPKTGWTIESQSDWESNTEAKTGLEFQDGMAVPLEASASFRSKLKVFENKQTPLRLVVSQFPVWDNWVAVPKVVPPNLGDAPVALSAGPGDYWLFGRYLRKPLAEFSPEEVTLAGFDMPLQTTQWPNQFNSPGGLKKSLGGYHAWQSRDMVNWVHHGPVSGKRARWMTTAEFVDGKAYFYYDFPNDADPHLIIDEDLTDGVPGKDIGMVFKDSTQGSDCAIIRDLDGKFHLISEDWSPIDASKHAWDSPLASHAMSPDGLGNFSLMTPAVDQRTQATGKTGTFRHPYWSKEDPVNYPSNVAEYEIHEPGQNAYGDWAVISIGGQYYLFGDFEPAGTSTKNMSIARFTSPDINTPFTFCGSFGSGHPDPDVLFAEGRFYLLSQTKQDFVSPGPWVERVEARVGVDTDNDGQVNEWSPWQDLHERYDHIPGFAKQIASEPAALDLSNLPAGYGFQIELKTTDTTENGSKPILNKLALSFVE